MVDGKEETVNTAVEGDYVVQANTRWKENYILSYATTSAAYDLDTPLETCLPWIMPGIMLVHSIMTV